MREMDSLYLLAWKKESDTIFSEQCLEELQRNQFQTRMPPELKAIRTLLLFNIETKLKDHTTDEIIEEI